MLNILLALTNEITGKSPDQLQAECGMLLLLIRKVLIRDLAILIGLSTF